MEYILELGVEEVSEEGVKQWRSLGYYVGWTADSSNLISLKREEAHCFPKREFAENVRNGDERLKASRIVEA